MADIFIEKIVTFIEENRLLFGGEKIVIGLSGGADSVCLFRVLTILRDKYDLGLSAVHVHHGIRGEDAEHDLAFSEALSAEFRVPFYSFRYEVRRMAAEDGLTVEEEGRRVRYEAFREVCRNTGSTVIAVAHHMDDQAETVLMNLLRGSGVRGCAGIAPKQAEIIRPLLCVRKSEILQWLEEMGCSWCTDATNSDVNYHRNRIRNILLPMLVSEYNPRACEHLAEAAQQFREADIYLSGQAREIADGFEKGELLCSVLNLLPHIMKGYVVREVISRSGAGLKDIGHMHIEAVIKLAQGSGSRKLDLPGGLRVYADYDRMHLEKTDRTITESNEPVSAIFSIFPLEKGKKIPQNCCVNWFDYDNIKGALLMRTRKSGDRMCVFADGKCKKLKDVMINDRIPAQDRDRLLLLAQGDRILWIPGIRMAEDCKVTSATRLVLQVELRKNSE